MSLQGRECWTPGMQGRSRKHLDARHAREKPRCTPQADRSAPGNHVCYTAGCEASLHDVDKNRNLIHLQCQWVECMSMDACAAMGEHRREHTRERSDGQAQLAENRPNAGVPHTDALSAAYLRESGSSSSASKYALLMTKMAPASSGPRPFPHQAAGISSASSRAGRFPKLDPWQTLRV